MLFEVGKTATYEHILACFLTDYSKVNLVAKEHVIQSVTWVTVQSSRWLSNLGGTCCPVILSENGSARCFQNDNRLGCYVVEFRKEFRISPILNFLPVTFPCCIESLVPGFKFELFIVACIFISIIILFTGLLFHIQIIMIHYYTCWMLSQPLLMLLWLNGNSFVRCSSLC